MAPPSNNVIREYHSDDSFQTRFGITPDVTEYQLCLAFATDSGDGKFKAAWDQNKVKPDVIKKFKEDFAASNLKVFVSIGGDHPFKVVDVRADEWVDNAKASLGKIIKDNGIDGIDVNYTTIQDEQYMFVNCIKDLITGLKEAQATTGFVASLAADAATNEGFYWPLYNACDKTSIETVVFDFFVDVQPQVTNNPVARLNQVKKIVEQYDHKGTKVLLGYRAIKDDDSITGSSSSISPLAFGKKTKIKTGGLLGKFGSAFGNFFRELLVGVVSQLTTDAITLALTVSAPKPSADA